MKGMERQIDWSKWVDATGYSKGGAPTSIPGLKAGEPITLTGWSAAGEFTPFTMPSLGTVTLWDQRKLTPWEWVKMKYLGRSDPRCRGSFEVGPGTYSVEPPRVP